MRRLCMYLSLLGVILIALEWRLFLQGKSLCQGVGCKLAITFARDETLLLAVGLIFFTLLVFLFAFAPSRITLYSFSTFSLLRIHALTHLRIIDVILLSALAAEGYLVGFQLFVLNRLCSFCLGVFGIVCLITIVYAFAYKRFYLVFSGILIWAAVLLATYLVSVPVVGRGLENLASAHYVKGTPQTKWYLFVKEDCPHCEKTLDYLLHQFKGDMDLYVCSAKKCYLLLRSLGIEEVPVLLIDKKGKKEILVGDSCICKQIEKKVQIIPELLPLRPPKGVCGIGSICE
ncbi:MAG: hypothetical protein LWW94_05295 [Candidatus Desulfofervidaceae bacterium]|nr:hypothetical protein [Candidatus Desulfofervidaceae bacterium]